jgi:hypothetical protein
VVVNALEVFTPQAQSRLACEATRPVAESARVRWGAFVRLGIDH